MRTYTVTNGEQTLKLTSDELAIFIEMYSVAPTQSARMSELLWLDIYMLDWAFGISPQEILGAISELEVGASETGTKPPMPFTGQVLGGLWHKHYFAARFVPQNLLMGLGKNGLRRLVEEVMDPAKSPTITKEMIAELARRVTQDNLESRDEAKRLTGEWVIYLPRPDGNYYLCCATHQTPDREILERIVANCTRDFPELPAWLEEARLPRD